MNLKILGISAEVVSSGHPGAKSRQIYRNLVGTEPSEFSSHHLLMDTTIDYLVVVGGVNDASGHIGAKFYAHHLSLIIEAAMQRGIKPIVVEVPEYGIEESQAKNVLSWVKRHLYLWLYDHGKIDVINDYREELQKNSTIRGLSNVAFIDFSLVTDDYHSNKDLFLDPSHLNSLGMKKLGMVIATAIAKNNQEQGALCNRI